MPRRGALVNRTSIDNHVAAVGLCCSVYVFLSVLARVLHARVHNVTLYTDLSRVHNEQMVRRNAINVM